MKIIIIGILTIIAITGVVAGTFWYAQIYEIRCVEDGGKLTSTFRCTHIRPDHGTGQQYEQKMFERDSVKTTKTPIEKLLVQNQISYDPNTLAVAGSITFGGGDPGCGAVVDYASNVHWFKVDSISNPTNMTLYNENPIPCKINHGSCFCNAQTAFAEVMLSELSYLTPTEEERIGQRVMTYFETIPHQIPVTKFVVGKYNLDLGKQYDEICGILLTKGVREDKFNEEYSVYKYFSAAKEGHRLWDFSLSIGSENLCAISDDAKIFEYEKQK